MERYLIDFGTGAGNLFANTIDKAMQLAKEGLAYTALSVHITDTQGKTVATLPWYGLEPAEDDIVTAKFGTFGFYGGWIFNN